MDQAGIQRDTVQIRYVNQPREAHWKSGSIKDPSGNLFNVPKEHLHHFQVNQQADILWEHTGKYPTVVGINGVLFKDMQPRNANWPAPPKQELTRVPDQPRQEVPPILSNVLAHAISAGVLTKPEDLPEWAKWTQEAIRSFHGEQSHSPAGQARNPQTEDPIPYETGDPGPFDA